MCLANNLNVTVVSESPSEIVLLAAADSASNYLCSTIVAVPLSQPLSNRSVRDERTDAIVTVMDR